MLVPTDTKCVTVKTFSLRQPAYMNGRQDKSQAAGWSYPFEVACSFKIFAPCFRNRSHV